MPTPPFGSDSEIASLRDLEAPYVLRDAAAARARASLEGDVRNLIFMASGPDDLSMAMLRNTAGMLHKLRLRSHVMLLVDTLATCERWGDSVIPGGCYWSSRSMSNPPSNSTSLQRYWDWRFRLYEPKKFYLAQLVRLGFGVLAADSDVVWSHDPFPLLQRISAGGLASDGRQRSVQWSAQWSARPNSDEARHGVGAGGRANCTLVVQPDYPLANAGLLYARPGPKTQLVLDELAWRIKLFQRHPEVVPRLVSWARAPYYSNSDDQTLLNDAIVSVATGQRDFHGSTARLEASNRHNDWHGPTWENTAEYPLMQHRLKSLHFEDARLPVPWQTGNADTSGSVGFIRVDLGGGECTALAPEALFSGGLHHFHEHALTHLQAVPGFNEKLKILKKHSMWQSDGRMRHGSSAAKRGGSATAGILGATGAVHGAMPPRTGRHVGYCAKTDSDTESDCKEGHLGAWALNASTWQSEAVWRHGETPADASERLLESACRRRCLECERCHFISFSVNWEDCSWFAECDLTALKKDVGGFRTRRVVHHSRAVRKEAGAASSNLKWQVAHRTEDRRTEDRT
jgi:hypothetical protein